MVALLVFLVVLVVIGVVSEPLVDGPVTPPLVLTLVGAAVAMVGGDVPDLDGATVLVATEIGLSLVLFVDASRIAPAALRDGAGAPLRLLVVALPLSVAFLTGLSMVALGLGLGQALLLGGALAATDAALARVVVESPRLPEGLRRVVNVESGLNDGLATPVVTFAIALSGNEMARSGVLDGFLVPIALAVVVGVVGGWTAGWLLRAGRTRDLVDPTFAQLATVAAIGTVVGASLATGAITFVAAFVAGVAFRGSCGAATADVVAYTEDSARLLTVAAFFVFGLTLVPTGLAELAPVHVVVVVVALTLGRMVPVWLSMLGTGNGWPTVAFVGWFGPRGLATVLFLLLAREELGDRLDPAVVGVLVATVLASLVVHGASAGPLGRAYASWVARDPGGRGAPGAMEDPDGPITGVGRTRR